MNLFSNQAAQQQDFGCLIEAVSGTLFVVGILMATVFAIQLLDQIQSILMETAVTSVLTFP